MSFDFIQSQFMVNHSHYSRRNFLKTTGLMLASGFVPSVTGFGGMEFGRDASWQPNTPQITHGIQIGDVQEDRAVIWSRCDRPAEMFVEFGHSPDFSGTQVRSAGLALADSDFTARIDIDGLSPGQDVFFKVHFRYLLDGSTDSEPGYGYFRTASNNPNHVRFLWSGDTCGQGWGINPELGGLRIYETMRRTDPDFFIHCGDHIYADCPIPESLIIQESGAIWRNLVTPEVSKVAETLDEFRGRYQYNLLDPHVRRFHAEVPQIWLWDDHEVTNNWSPGKDLLADPRYAEKNIGRLVSYGTRAALEYAPIRTFRSASGRRIYRKISYGPLLDVFVLDMRSYRAANNANRQAEVDSNTAYLGREQLDWLKAELLNSTAVWKVLAADMPLGLQLGDGFDGQHRRRFENMANGDGPVLGREWEMAELLAFARKENIVNMVWFTADVHYCAAHFYDPGKARFQNFEPFWEFVSGPLNAGSFGAQALDDTFGPQLIFQKASPAHNLSPASGMQFFGQVDIDGGSLAMIVSLKDVDGQTLFEQTINALAN